MIAIVGIRNRNDTHYILYTSCLPIYGIAIVRSLSFLFLDDFEGNANISAAIKSGSTVDGESLSVLGGPIFAILCFLTLFYWSHIAELSLNMAKS